MRIIPIHRESFTIKRKLQTNFLFALQEECKGHGAALGKQEKSLDRVIEARRVKKLKENVYIEERLKHLTVQDGWD